jgi:hypothetical protein
MAAGCGEITDGPSLTPDASPMTVENDAQSIPPPPIQPLLAFSLDGTLSNSGTATGTEMQAPNGLSYVAGKFGSAFSSTAFMYGEVTGMKSLLGSEPNVTIGFWYSQPFGTTNDDLIDVRANGMAPYGGVAVGIYGGALITCAATATELTAGGCLVLDVPAPETAWHHVLLQYDGVGTSEGQGGPLRVYVDGKHAGTIVSPKLDPIFTPAIDDRMIVGGGEASLVDDIQVYGHVLSEVDGCTKIVKGTWNGAACAMP